MKEGIELQLNNDTVGIFYYAKPRLKHVNWHSTQGDIMISFYEANGMHSWVARNGNVQLTTEIEEYKESNTIVFYASSTDIIISADDTLSFVLNDIPSLSQILSFYKYGPVKAWTHPISGRNIEVLPSDDQIFALWKYSDSLYAALVPLGGDGFMAEIGKVDQKLAVKLQAGYIKNSLRRVPICAISFNTDPYMAIEQAYTNGLESMGLQNALRSTKQYPEWMNYIGWCTWNTYGHNVNGQSIADDLKTFANKGFTPTWLLIDDGWSQVTAYGTGKLKSMEVEPKKFPGGLRYWVDQFKNQGVKLVGIWHAFTGYWAGVDTESPLFEKMRAVLIPYKDKVAWDDKPECIFYAPAPGVADNWYDAWYTYFKNEGIDFVKVDNQLVADRISKGNMPLADAAQGLQKQLQNAVRQYFDGRIINCMDMTTDAVYYYGNSPIGRSSEDFFPENQSFDIRGGNAAIHVICNAYNSLWWSQMVWPDYDMFQSHHPQAEYHAIARVLSGGPVYITDVPQKADVDLIKKLFVGDDQKILRTDQPGKVAKDCLFDFLGNKPLKIGATVGKVGLLGIFNTNPEGVVKGNFTLEDIYDLKKEAEVWYIYEHGAEEGKLIYKTDQVVVDLEYLQAKLYYAIPVENNIAIVGLLNKYNAPATVSKVENSVNQVQFEVIEAGKLGFYINKTPSKSIVDGRDISQQIKIGWNVIEGRAVCLKWD